jgi:hypothetical protein
LLFASAAAAAEIEAPRVTVTQVDWAAAAGSLSGHDDSSNGAKTPTAEFARISEQTAKRFKNIGKASVPVLLPMDSAGYLADAAAGKAEAATSDKYFGPFHPNLFVPGPAGYTATFLLNQGDGGFTIHYKKKPIEIEITGAGFTYDLDGPDHQEVFPVKDLQDAFPGIQRILREAHVRYLFTRFGVPYVVSIQCYDMRPSTRHLSCREADPIAVKFLRQLNTAGGTPQKIAEPHLDLARPEKKSSDFTYYGPGDLIPNTGWRKMPGRADYHVYAEMRFPIANAPAYIKSQSFMPWGDCYRSGHSGRLGRKDAAYACKVNGLPLTFNEAAAVNFNYPWRDNFCELRDFLVGQCPGGYGHQGEDIRPSNCVQDNEGADRCLPYQHSVAAVRDGPIWRLRGNLAAYLVLNTANEFVRLRYLHMNPKMMDDEGLVTGREVSQGEIIGKVATWGDFESGTSYHLHFNMQVFTKVGWVWVNPYMSLVLAYERMIGARGSELHEGDVVPPVPAKPPVVLHPPIVPEPKQAPTISADNAKPAESSTVETVKPPEQRAAETVKPVKHVKPERKRKPRRHRRRRHRSDDD